MFMAFELCNHGRTSGERFPAVSEATGAKRPGRIENMMTNFGMGHIRAAVKLSIQDDPASDTRADRHIDQSRLASSTAPAGLPEG